MRILTSKTFPSAHELTEVLKREFSDAYSYELFGLENEKSILVHKSTFVGAQISKRENEITIQATPPSMAMGNSLLFLSLIGVDTILGLLYGSQLKKLEKEVAVFLNQKYN